MSAEISPELQSKYLARRSEDVRKLRVALRNKNLEAFNEVGAQMSSTASNFGFPELEKIAAVLVRASDEKTQVNAGDVLEDFADCLVGLSADVKKNLPVQ